MVGAVSLFLPRPRVIGLAASLALAEAAQTFRIKRLLVPPPPSCLLGLTGNLTLFPALMKDASSKAYS